MKYAVLETNQGQAGNSWAEARAQPCPYGLENVLKIVFSRLF